jgi:hypothetical protein
MAFWYSRLPNAPKPRPHDQAALDLANNFIALRNTKTSHCSHCTSILQTAHARILVPRQTHTRRPPSRPAGSLFRKTRTLKRGMRPYHVPSPPPALRNDATHKWPGERVSARPVSLNVSRTLHSLSPGSLGGTLQPRCNPASATANSPDWYRVARDGVLVIRRGGSATHTRVPRPRMGSERGQSSVLREGRVETPDAPTMQMCRSVGDFQMPGGGFEPPRTFRSSGF